MKTLDEKAKILLEIWDECFEAGVVDDEVEFEDAFSVIRDAWLSEKNAH
jgi:hypothetical protein